MKNEIASMELTIKAAQDTYDDIKNINESELKRFQTSKENDFRSMVHSIACVQAAFADRSAEVWVNVAKDLGATKEQIDETQNVVL